MESGVADRAQVQPLSTPVQSIFTVDVEDWFHILDTPATPKLEDWCKLPSLVERNFTRLLNLFDDKHAKVTCFFLGWVAERFPNLVRDAAARGHEIASHGYAHQLTYELTPEQFRQDVTHSRQLLEDIAGQKVIGYRSPGFSISERFFETLAEAGYEYDASVFPAPHGHGGMRTKERTLHRVSQNGRGILEFPVSVVDILGQPICFSGGGYLRLFPYVFIRKMTQRLLQKGQPVVFYIHPREIDPHHPRLEMSLSRRFKSYINIESTERKLARLLDEFRVTSFQDFLTYNPHTWRANQ